MSDVRLITRNERWAEMLRKKAVQAVTKATKVADKEFRKNVSHTDHTLADLRALGHPYGYTNPQQIHDPDWLIHKQSGGLLANSVQEPMVTETTDSVVGQFGFYPDALPMWLVFGTTKMRPRPVVKGTLAKSRAQIEGIIKETMKQRYGENVEVFG